MNNLKKIYKKFERTQENKLDFIIGSYNKEKK